MNGSPLFDGTNYASYSMILKAHLSSLVFYVWNSKVSSYTPPKRVKYASQKDVRKAKNIGTMEFNQEDLGQAKQTLHD